MRPNQFHRPHLTVQGQPVCDDHWGIEDAHVACRMMGYLGAEAAVMYGTVPDDFLMDDVQCGGGEESLLHCR